MNVFEKLIAELQKATARKADLRIEFDQPISKSGLWSAYAIANDGYVLEIGWQKHRGFALSADYDSAFGEGFDELFDTREAVLERALALLDARECTNSDRPLSLAELRKLLGVLQNDLAEQLGMTKGGLAQLEKAGSLGKMQVGTVEKLISGLGGKLVLTAKLPNGETRELVN
jgi:DNA-binding XRE family transcriptional regulator